jgi:hypothetical protein
MSLTKDGISTTRNRGKFAYEQFYSAIKRRNLVQWDYRDTSGKLHSGIAKSLEAAIVAAAEASAEMVN